MFTPFYHRSDDPAKMTISRLAFASRGLTLSSLESSSAVTWQSEDRRLDNARLEHCGDDDGDGGGGVEQQASWQVKGRPL